MPVLVPMVSLDQKSHATCHFDHLDCRNSIVLLTMPSTWHNADTNTNAIGIMLSQYGAHGITWHRESCCTSFQLSQLRKAVVPLMMFFASHYPNVMSMASNDQSIMLHLISILSTPRNAMLLFLCHWHCVMPGTDLMALHDQESQLHFILIILT